MAKKKDKIRREKKNNFELGMDIIRSGGIFGPLLEYADIVYRGAESGMEYAVVSNRGSIYVNHKLKATPREWAYIIAHCLLHLGLGHFDRVLAAGAEQRLWNYACDAAIRQLLRDMKIGTPPAYMPVLPDNLQDEEGLFSRFQDTGVTDAYRNFGTAGLGPDMIFDEPPDKWDKTGRTEWTRLFAQGLAQGVRDAVNAASGKTLPDGGGASKLSPGVLQARDWFISQYPLLGAIAASFTIIEDHEICRRMDIRVAAVSPALRELYINPFAGLGGQELRFVMAHEFLHAALRHDARHEWRDRYLWNVACDYVINQWLVEMGVGEMPAGCLLEPQFKGLSAEAVYERIVTDMRLFRKLATLRGVGVGDILGGEREWWKRGDGVNLDEFYRRALGQGLSYHEEQARGYLPAGLIEEIRALTQPPIPWDVELARWFDEHFTPLEKRRSFARPSRRQSSTPDIPRPNWIIRQESLDRRTFGVVLDTSGSMDRALLAAALGSIASYSAARDVPAARVVFCDAAVYDQGYMKTGDIAGAVQVKGRGGTVLQPGIRLLLEAEDFPKTAPILIITDGCCDVLALSGREHAYLMPAGARLPFVPKGKVFRLR